MWEKESEEEEEKKQFLRKQEQVFAVPKGNVMDFLFRTKE